MPPNILGTDELADAAAHVAKLGKAQFSRIIDKDLIDKKLVGKGLQLGGWISQL